MRGLNHAAFRMGVHKMIYMDLHVNSQPRQYPVFGERWKNCKVCTAWANQITRRLLAQKNSSKKLQAVLKQNEECSKFGTGDYIDVFNSELILKKMPEWEKLEKNSWNSRLKTYGSKGNFVSNAQGGVYIQFTTALRKNSQLVAPKYVMCAVFCEKLFSLVELIPQL